MPASPTDAESADRPVPTDAGPTADDEPQVVRDEPPVVDPTSAGGAGPIWPAVAGALTLVYVVWYILDLFVLDLSPSLFNRVHQGSGGLVPRLVFAVLGVGIVSHALDGLRRAVCDLRPRWRAHDVGLRALVRFATLAVSIPGVLAVVWPAIRGWWAR